MEKQKVCFVTTHFDFPRERMIQYYEKIFPSNVQLYLFCHKESVPKFKLTRTKIFSYDCSKWKMLWEVRKFCKKEGIERVINLSAGNMMAIMLVLANLFLRTKVIFYDKGNPEWWRLLSLVPFQFLLYKILASSPDVTTKQRRWLGLSNYKIDNLTTSINTNFFYPMNKNECRKKTKLNLKDKILGFVGRIEWIKGSDFMFEAIKKNSDKKFLLVGPLKDKKILWAKNNLKNVIHIPSLEAKDLKYYYNACDLCLHLSRKEGMGIAYREFMACGVPAIVLNIEGVRTVKKAIKVPFNNKIIQEKIDWFFNLNKEELEKLCKETRENIVQDYSDENLKERYHRLLLE